MKKLVKTALCLLLCALLSLPALAEVAAASKALTNGVYVTSGDYTYTLLEDGSARIIDYTGDAEALTVPAELDGHLVRQIGDRAFTACFSLTSVTLPEGLTSIGEDSFQRCESLAVSYTHLDVYKRQPSRWTATTPTATSRPSAACTVWCASRRSTPTPGGTRRLRL